MKRPFTWWDYYVSAILVLFYTTDIANHNWTLGVFILAAWAVYGWKRIP